MLIKSSYAHRGYRSLCPLHYLLENRRRQEKPQMVAHYSRCRGRTRPNRRSRLTRWSRLLTRRYQRKLTCYLLFSTTCYHSHLLPCLYTSFHTNTQRAPKQALSKRQLLSVLLYSLTFYGPLCLIPHLLGFWVSLLKHKPTVKNCAHKYNCSKNSCTFFLSKTIVL